MVFKKQEKVEEKVTPPPVVVPEPVKPARVPAIMRVRFSQPVECKESKTSFTVEDDGSAEYFDQGVVLTFKKHLCVKSGKPRRIKVYFSNIAYIEEET